MAKNGTHVNGKGETVVVACKLPNGIVLQLCKKEQATEQTPSGPRTVEIGVKSGDKYVVRGASIPWGTTPKYLMVGGYALTSGIPREFWDEWLRQNDDNDFVKRGLVFAHVAMEDTEAHAMEGEKVSTGLEPIDPNRLPKGITTATEQEKRV
jgi:hypothetical protein